MTEKTKEQRKKQNEMLANLRKERNEKVKEAQAMLKEQMNIRKQISVVLQGEAKTIPQISEETNLPSDQVLWYIAAMKKYGNVVEAGLDDDYEFYLYSLAKETVE